jgi:hypothetical protein
MRFATSWKRFRQRARYPAQSAKGGQHWNADQSPASRWKQRPGFLIVRKDGERNILKPDVADYDLFRNGSPKTHVAAG